MTRKHIFFALLLGLVITGYWSWKGQQPKEGSKITAIKVDFITDALIESTDSTVTVYDYTLHKIVTYPVDGWITSGPLTLSDNDSTEYFMRSHAIVTNTYHAVSDTIIYNNDGTVSFKALNDSGYVVKCTVPKDWIR